MEAQMDKKHIVKLSAMERAELCTLVRSGRAPARQVNRARILLKADRGGENCTDAEIAETLEIGIRTVERIRERFAKERTPALDRRPQPRRPDKQVLDGRGEAKLVMLACSKPPAGHGRWT